MAENKTEQGTSERGLVDGTKSRTRVVLNPAEGYDITRCGFGDLVSEEVLILSGVAQILNELGCSPDETGKGNDDEIELPALALWTLGKVARRATEELVQKLDIAQERLTSVGVPELLTTRMSQASSRKDESE